MSRFASCEEDGFGSTGNQVQLQTKSEQAVALSLKAIHRERISKTWNPRVSTSYSTRQLRGEAHLSFGGWVAGLDRLVNAGHGEIARAAVQPVLDLVQAEWEDEDSGVIRLGGNVYQIRVEKGGSA